MFGRDKKKEQLKKEETTRTQTEEEERKKREEEEKKRREEEESRKRKEEEERKKKEAERKAAEDKRQKEEKKQKEKEQKEKERQRQRENDKSREAEEKIELAQLEEITLGEDESPTLPVDLYHNFTKESFSAYTKLQTFSREQNTHLVMPEFVIIGKQGHGKSSLLEAFLGYPWNVVGYNGATKRPIYLYVVNSPECKEPKITVKRDSALHEFDSDIQISLKDLQKEITKRNRIFTTEPIYVQYEIADMWNITIIDTPGILSDDKSNPSNPSGSAPSSITASASVTTINKDSGASAGVGGPNEMNKAKVESLIYSLCRPLHRHILCVEEAREWERVEMIDFLKPLDPELTRTTFVYTNFVSLLSKYTTTRQINRYLSDTIPAVKTYFVSLFALTSRSAADTDEKYKEKVWQAYRRDINILESLQYDKRHEEKMGMYRLRKHLMNMAWLIFQQGVPTILKTIRQKKATAQRDSQTLQQQLKGLTTLKLRTIASDYGVEFLQLLQSVLSGSAVANPSLIGQTLEEEKSHHGDAEWLDGSNNSIRVLPHEWGIRYYDHRLYGGQQFERLLHEFKAVCEHCEASEVTMDDVATAAGNQFGNYAWASSDLARQKTEEALGPMIEKVLHRALYIVIRLLDLVEKILEEQRNKRKKVDHHHPSGEKIIDVEDLDNYKYFTFHIKDLFVKYVETAAKNCHEKCFDEFMLTTTIYWDYTEHVDKPPMDPTADQSKLVIQCTSDIFRILRTRIIKNVIYKLYNFFLVPIQTDLWNALQGKLSQLSDQQLDQIFEVSATREKVNEQVRKLESLIQQCSSLENDLLQVSYQYSHQSHLELD